MFYIYLYTTKYYFKIDKYYDILKLFVYKTYELEAFKYQLLNLLQIIDTIHVQINYDSYGFNSPSTLH